MNKENRGQKKQKYFIFLGIFIFLAVLFIVFISYKSFMKSNKEKNSKITNVITLNYTSSTNEVVITSDYKLQDEVATKLKSGNNVFDFSISSDIKKNTYCNYELVAVKDVSSTIPDDKIKIFLQKADNSSYSDLVDVIKPSYFTISDNIKLTDERGMLLEKGKVNKSNTYYYRLIIWVDPTFFQNVDITNEIFKIKINIYART